MKVLHFFFLFLSLLFALNFISAVPVVSIGGTTSGTGPEVIINPVTPASSSNSTVYWSNISSYTQIPHNSLDGLQGGTTSERYHLNQSVFQRIVDNVWNFLIGNPHDQDLNTTDDVIFKTLNLTCDGLGDNESCMNVTGDAYFETIHAQDAYFGAETVYIGEEISLSAGGVGGSVLNVTGGNISTEYYFGSGLYLTDIDWTGINFTNATINANTFNGSAFTLNGTTIYDWSVFEVNAFSINVEMTTAGGSASGVTPSFIGFEIKEIKVVPTTSNTNYRFEAVEFTNGDIIDKDRTAHSGEWRIAKNYVIDDKVNLSITNSNNDELFTVTIKYLNQQYSSL